MMRYLMLFLLFATPVLHGQERRVLAFYTEHAEKDHVDFAHQAIAFFAKAGDVGHYTWHATQDWNELLTVTPGSDSLIVWLNDEPHTPEQRAAFEKYMEAGGAWLGFHASAYNDRGTHWPWFVSFLGGAVFRNNNWPPLPATLRVETHESPVTEGMPGTYVAPANEWYSWSPDPRDDKDVRVLLSLAPANYPLGFKDTLTGGDIPVVWTNQRYRMLYVNMGHGDKIFDSDLQNAMFGRAMAWLLAPAAKP